MPYFVVTEPESIRGIYHSWDECKSKVNGITGAKYQKVQDLEQARAMIESGGVVLSPGLHVFTDGNHHGGVGVVVVWMPDGTSEEPVVVTEIATSVGQVFHGGVIPGLDDDAAVGAALEQVRNVLAELAGLYLALWQAPEEAHLSIVHDYKGVGDWMEGRWKAKDPVVKAVVTSCRGVVESKRLQMAYTWQHGHTSAWAGRHDLARFNARADALATRGGSIRAL